MGTILGKVTSYNPKDDYKYSPKVVDIVPLTNNASSRDGNINVNHPRDTYDTVRALLRVRRAVQYRYRGSHLSRSWF